MTIAELILAALQTKFPGVESAILTRIANKKGEGVTDENAVNSIVEGITFQDVLTSYGDFRAGDARLTAIRGYEKQHNLKDGKPIENPRPKPQPQPNPQEQPDIDAIVKAAVDNAVKPYADKLAQFEAERNQATRAQQISAKAKEYGIPESLVSILSIKEDADLDAFMEDAKQTFINAGLSEVKPPEQGGSPKTENEEIAGMISARTKEIVESKK
ncbi:MAG: hypothetical protein HDR77_02635 [Bacteroides sp.]|nr:hypothetical protein [Bacteroides sp.]